MIQVDISNIWGEVSLTDLLGTEAELSAAHMDLTNGGAVPGWMDLPEKAPTAEHIRLLAVANRIRETSDVLVVAAAGNFQAGPKGLIELLQGPDRNLKRSRGEPLILWAGSSLSTRAWNELTRLLEGKDFSLCVIAGADTVLEQATAFRSLRWMLERRYGTAQAKRRIYAVADANGGALRKLAGEEGWETFSIPAGVPGEYAVLTPAGLLPMAVAGIDVMALLKGAKAAKAELDLRSFENPVWLYAAARYLMDRRGKTAELLGSFEPGFAGLARWQQQLFGGCGKALPVWAELPRELHALQGLLCSGGGSIYETMLRFAPPARREVLWEDVKDYDGLNHLSGKYLDQLEEQVYFDTMAAHSDSGCPVVSIDCGGIREEALGGLIWFFQLTAALCRKIFL